MADSAKCGDVKSDMCPSGSSCPDWARPQRLKICLTCSHGGHLTEMLALADAFAGHDKFYFTYDADTTRRLSSAYLVANMAKNPVEFVKNLFRVTRIFRKERPDLVVSTGAEIALPVLLVAKVFRVPIFYIECGAQVAHPSFTGRIMYWMADRFHIQWPELMNVYGGRAIFHGSLIDQDEPFQNDRSDLRRMKVTLVQSPQPASLPIGHPPMQLGYVASSIEQQGCEVRVVDAAVERLAPDQVAAILAQQRPGMVYFEIAESTLRATLATVRWLRQLPDSPVLVAGGPYAMAGLDELLAEGLFDYVARMEVEETVPDLVRNLLDGGNIDNVRGLSWRKSGQIIHNEDRLAVDDAEHGARPDWSLFPLRQYASLTKGKRLVLPIATSRGEGPLLRLRQPQAVVDEWDFLVKRYRADAIVIIDEAFGCDPERAVTICRSLIERGLNRVPWVFSGKISARGLSPEMNALMTQAGCRGSFSTGGGDAM